jgi:UDP:flavonoid glycosyltransferase YjiC (YdhE family)
MRILFASTSGGGHFSPLVPFAHACQRAGHDVLVAGPAGAAPLAQRACLAFRPVAEPSHEDVLRFRSGQAGLGPMQAMARALTGLYVDLYGGAALPGMLAAIEEWRPDVVVRESAEFASTVAAECLGVPQAQVAIGLSMQADKLLPLAAPSLDKLRARVGLPADPDGQSLRSLQLTMAPRSLEDPSHAASSGLVRRFRVPTGDSAESVLDGFGDPDAPLVYLSFGTEVPSRTRDYFPGVYRDALDALAGMGLRILVTVGDQRDPAELGPLPSSVRVERWVPQAAVMREAAAMVGHGGAGSVLLALAAGVPMVLVPMFADQPVNARRVAEVGAGVALADGPTSMPGLQPAVHAVLNDPRYRDRARRIAHEIQALPPIDHAARALTALVSRPVPRS